MDQKLKPIFLENAHESLPFTSVPTRGPEIPPFPSRNRISHSEKLIQHYLAAIQDFATIQTNVEDKHDGVYIDFIGSEEFELAVQSLEELRSGIRLLNVDIESDPPSATVYIPNKKVETLLKKIKDYKDKPTSKTNDTPKNSNLVTRIEAIYIARVKSFWKSHIDKLPKTNREWCEVWILNDHNRNTHEIQIKLQSFAAKNNIAMKDEYLQFPESLVFLLKVNEDDLVSLIKSISYICEFKLAKTTASFWLDMPIKEQKASAEELLSRVEFSDGPVQIAILDAGINNGHQLLEKVIKDDNLLTVNSSWGTHDHHRQGHGTLMAGLATYGNLEHCLETSSKITIAHKLCSVKILPPVQHNDKELWGSITKTAIEKALDATQDKRLIACMAVTSDEEITKGKPTSWSAAIDQTIFTYKIPFFVAAGNIDPAKTREYIKSNRESEVQDPAQAWNVVTVGAYTEKASIQENLNFSFEYVAKAGELSPYSSTSCTWDKQWPKKPDIVFEGGNQYRDSHAAFEHEDLSLLSTYHKPFEHQFGLFNQTSAATAQASNFAAKILQVFPSIWSETLKGLIVHSAEWTDAMKQQMWFNEKITPRERNRNLLRTVGYGVPSLERALYCLRNRLTLIAQEEIQPYYKDKDGIKTNQMHLYSLPWPEEALKALGEQNIKMRVTLSYFIEPAPNDDGKFSADRYRYASHGLRFDVNNPLEGKDDFVKRKNKQLQDDLYESSELTSSKNWTIGDRNRRNGTTASDIWEGSAIELSRCNFIAVHPIIGWWKTRSYLKKWDSVVKYSLIVSILTEDETTDIYTPVANILKIPVVIPS